MQSSKNNNEKGRGSDIVPNIEPFFENNRVSKNVPFFKDNRPGWNSAQNVSNVKPFFESNRREWNNGQEWWNNTKPTNNN